MPNVLHVIMSINSNIPDTRTHTADVINCAIAKHIEVFSLNKKNTMLLVVFCNWTLALRSNSDPVLYLKEMPVLQARRAHFFYWE